MTDRIKLHGTYRTPRFRLGAKVKCQVRGELTIVGVTDAPIPWPLGKHGRGAKSLVVYGDLARAVRRESVSAIRHWFGAHDVTVWKWRKWLGVPERNYGTRKLWEKAASAGYYWKGVKAGVAKSRDPVRRAKIATGQRGRRRPNRQHPLSRMVDNPYEAPQTPQPDRKRRRLGNRLRELGDDQKDWVMLGIGLFVVAPLFYFLFYS